MRGFIIFLLAACSLHAANAPVYSVKLYKEDSILLAPGVLRVLGVTDLRQLGKQNPRLLGSSSVGVFQERVWLWSSDPVDLSVKNQLRRWFPKELPKSVTTKFDSAVPAKSDSAARAVSDSSATALPTKAALPVQDSATADSLENLVEQLPKDTTAGKVLPIRVEILSFETWSIPTANPAAVKARVRLRILAAASDWQGKIAEVEAGADREGPNTPEDQVELLRLSLRKAMLAFMEQNWRHAQPLASFAEPGPTPDPWTDALKRTGEAMPSSMRTLVHAGAAYGLAGYGFSLRAVSYHEPEEDWNSEYWAALRFRDVKADSLKYGSTWVGEVVAGIGWQRRLGANTSSFVVSNGVGGIFGNERYSDSTTRNGWRRESAYYIGAEGRSAIRYEPVGSQGLSAELGAHASLRLPSELQVFDIGAYLEWGWRF
jgi:hypothetical protein